MYREYGLTRALPFTKTAFRESRLSFDGEFELLRAENSTRGRGALS